MNRKQIVKALNSCAAREELVASVHLSKVKNHLDEASIMRQVAKDIEDANIAKK